MDVIAHRCVRRGRHLGLNRAVAALVHVLVARGVRVAMGVRGAVAVGRHRPGVDGDMPAASIGDERLEDPLAHGRDRRGIGPGERDDRPPVTGRTPLALHPVDVDADIRGEICLVDDEQVGAGDARPTLRTTSPPPATSSTKICASTSAGENVAVRLSPPDSTSTRSRGAKSSSRSSTARRFIVTSSRIAVCGQAPVSTARIRAGSSTPAARSIRASSSV